MKISKDQKFSTTTTTSFLKHHEFVALRTDENDISSEVVRMVNETKKAQYLYMNAGEKRVRILNFTNSFKVIFVNKKSTHIV